VRRSYLAVFIALGLIQGIPAAAGTSCADPGTVLLGTADATLVAYTPSGSVWATPQESRPEWTAWVGRQVLAPAGPSRWRVERAASDQAVSIRIVDTFAGEVVVQASFAKRIELAASAVVPGGGYALYLQGNNVASELTILDARLGTTRSVLLPHDADLAPYAITFAFSPSLDCVAISLERVFGHGPETWLVDLATGTIRLVNLSGLTVERWVRTSG
jgi:hypothetical protein